MMRGIQNAFVLSGLVGSALVACGGEGLPPPPPPQATGDVAGLRVLVDSNVPITSSDSDCTPAIAAAPSDIVNALEASLSKAGLRVIADQNAAHDATLKVRAEFASCGNGSPRPWVAAGVGVAGVVFARLEADGSVIAQASTSGSLKAGGIHQADFAADVTVRQLLASPALASFASAQKAAPPQSTPAQVASQPAPVAAPPAPPTPAPAPAPAGPTFVAAAPQPNAFAVVVGVEKYLNGLPVPVGAHADAQRFADLARSTLGVDAGHLQVVLDEQATRGGIARALDWAKSSTPAGGRIYFYFSGHGAPDAAGGTPYIVPSDGDPKDLDATAIPMKDVFAKLGASKAREVLAVVDSCFSGAGGRSVLPPGARPIVRIREEAAPAQLALFSASSGTEISGPTSSGNGGLFTKVVLDGLGTGAADINGDGQVSLQELSTWVTPRVSREAKKDNRDQNPSLTVGKGLGSADSFIVEWGLAAK